MKPYACPHETFRRDVEGHQMTVIRANGADRHLMFRKPGRSEYWFEILTWPGSLCIHGDMGTQVFSRLSDMFEFFRSSGSHINPSYWQEKLPNESRDSTERFEWDTFVDQVKEHFDQAWHADEPDAEICAKRDACWEALSDALDSAEPDEYGAANLIRSFEHAGWRFEDYEASPRQYTFHYIWLCYAIVWAIEQFDASQQQVAA